jgi:hypothetical protein
MASIIAGGALSSAFTPIPMSWPPSVFVQSMLPRPCTPKHVALVETTASRGPELITRGHRLVEMEHGYSGVYCLPCVGYTMLWRSQRSAPYHIKSGAQQTAACVAFVLPVPRALLSSPDA